MYNAAFTWDKSTYVIFLLAQLSPWLNRMCVIT